MRNWLTPVPHRTRVVHFNAIPASFQAASLRLQMDTRWFAESGVLDMYVMLGPKPKDIFQQYARLTGTTSLPPVSHGSGVPVILIASLC